MKKNLFFFLKILLVLTLVAAIVLPVNFLYMSGETYQGAQRGMEKFKTVPDNIQLANFGPSYGMYCFSYDDLTKGGKTCFNFALSMQDLYHDYQIYRTYADRFAPGAVVAVTLSYFSFCSDNSDVSSARYYKILDNDSIKGYTAENDFSANYLPVYGKGSSVVRDVVNDTLNAIMKKSVYEESGIGQNVQTQEDALLAAFALDSQVRVMTIENGNLKAYSSYIRENEALLTAWIKQMQADGLHPVLVLTPYWHDYANGFDPQLLDKCYSQPLQNVIDATDVPYLNFNEGKYAEFGENTKYFRNCDHVSLAGTTAFMTAYTAYLKETGITIP